MTLGIVIEQLTELLGEASQRERPLAAVAIIAGRGVAEGAVVNNKMMEFSR